MERICFPDGVNAVLGSRTLSKDDIGRSSAFVAFAGDDLVIKCAEAGALQNAERMQRFFFENGLAPEVVYFESSDRDYLVSKRARGESAVSRRCLNEPRRLARALGEFLKTIHSLSAEACPVRDLTSLWIRNFSALDPQKTVFNNYVVDFLKVNTKETAFREARSALALLRSDTVLHGDFCLPNIMLADFCPVQVIDTGEGGVGDRHFDLFWGLWSLNYNLKTDAYGDDFLSAYGKEGVDMRLIRACGCLCALE